MASTKLKINERFVELHRDLSSEELKELETSIEEDGIRESVVVMQGDVIVDGHHRHTIAQKLKIETPIVIKTFDSDDAAERWILRRQLARRNLSVHDYKLTIGRLYNVEKQSHGGDRKSNRQNDRLGSTEQRKTTSTAEIIAEESKTSTRTVERNAKYADAYDQLPKAVKALISEKPSRATDKAVQKMATMDASELTPIARSIRVGQSASFDEALGMKSVAAAHKKVKPDDSPPDWKTQRSKAIKTVEALMRAMDDLHELKPDFKRWDRCLNDSKAVLAELQGWGA